MELDFGPDVVEGDDVFHDVFDVAGGALEEVRRDFEDEFVVHHEDEPGSVGGVEGGEVGDGGRHGAFDEVRGGALDEGRDGLALGARPELSVVRMDFFQPAAFPAEGLDVALVLDGFHRAVPE